MSMKANNHKNYMRSLQQEAREKRMLREEELANGSPLNAREKAYKLEEEIEAFEERVGFDDAHMRKPHVVSTTGSSARSAFNPNGTLRNLYSDGSYKGE